MANSWTWTNANDNGDWNDVKNWSPQGTPQDGDEVTIPAEDAQGNTGVNGPTGAPALTVKALTLQGLTLYDGPFTVTDTLTWTGGTADADVVVAGTAEISGLDGSSANPAIINQHKLTVTGVLAITGDNISATSKPQFGISTGSELLNTGTVTLSGAGFNCPAGFGTLTNRGSLSVSGSCHSTDVVTMTHARGAQLTIASGGEFVVGHDVALRLAGGAVSGTGTLRVGDGDGGEIDIVTDTTVPQLVIGGNGTVAPGLGAGTPSPSLPGILTVTHALGWGHGAVGTQYSGLLGHLVLAPEASGVIENHCFIADGKFENAGHITVASDAALELEGALPVIVNTGTLTMTAPSTVAGGSLTNAGLIEKTGSSVAVLNTGLMNHGNVAVIKGTLQIGDADWTVAGGTINIRGAKVAGPGLGRLILAGGTEGGVLTGAGTVAATVINGGWVEPTPPGLSMNEYAQQPDGNIALSGASATSNSPLLTLGGVNLHLDGSLWLLS